MAQQANGQQLAFGFVVVDAAEKKPGPANLAEAGVSGYQDLYKRLIEQGWRWQKAAFMAWRAAPRGSRQPSTQDELAKMLGYRGDKIFRVWLDKPEQGPLMQRIISQAARLVFEAHLADVDLVTINQAVTPDSSVAQRELFYKRYRDLTDLVGGAQQDDDNDDLNGLTDEELDSELARIAGQAAKTTPVAA